ncbi:MAG: hypothetical protein JXA66_03325 [Oligoflexia bacterium]|nr:hypothetical protein [Oligoflexia bacterium]
MNIFYNSLFGLAELSIRHRNKRIHSVDILRGFTSRNIPEICAGLEPKGVIPYIERIEQSSHNHYAVCYCMLVENMLDINISAALSMIRTVFLELERTYCHTLQLIRLLGYAQVPSIVAGLYEIKNLIIDCFENITGHRIFHSVHIPGGLRINFTPGNIELVRETVASVGKIMQKVRDSIVGNVSLGSIFGNVAVIYPSDANRTNLTGCLAWCGGDNNDLRITRPYLSYKEPAILEILSAGRDLPDKNSAYSRIIAIVDDIGRSLDIIAFAVEQDLIYDYRNITLSSVLPSGFYRQKIETPRGIAVISIKTGMAGKTEKLDVVSPSDTNIKIINDALRGTIVDYAQMALDSMYVSIMEMDK